MKEINEVILLCSVVVCGWNPDHCRQKQETLLITGTATDAGSPLRNLNEDITKSVNVTVKRNMTLISMKCSTCSPGGGEYRGRHPGELYLMIKALRWVLCAVRISRNHKHLHTSIFNFCFRPQSYFTTSHLSCNLQNFFDFLSGWRTCLTQGRYTWSPRCLKRGHSSTPTPSTTRTCADTHLHLSVRGEKLKVNPSNPIWPYWLQPGTGRCELT